MKNISSSFWLCVALLIFLTGCASVPLGSKEQDAAAKQFEAPADKGRIYVYRNEFMGGAVKIPITLDGKVAGSTLKNTYLAFDVDPGTHEAGCLGETSGKTSVDVQAGQAAYVWQEMKMGMWAASCAMHVVEQEQGQKGVRECVLALPE